MTSGPITSWQIDRGTVTDFILGGSKITADSDFGAQENKVCHCFHFSPIYLPQSEGTYAYLKLLIFLSAMLIPASASSSPEIHTM